MRHIVVLILIAIFALAFYFGCSQLGGPNPETPQVARNDAGASSPLLWGVWDVSITRDGVVEAVPLHAAEFALNVAGLITPPDLKIWIVDISGGPGYIDYTIDAGITHTYTHSSSFTGFDVCGVLMGYGDTAHPIDPELTYGSTGELHLLNADGYSRWMNRPEFGGGDMGFFGYVDKNAGTPGYLPDATLNPYKYYCDGLGTEQNAHDYLLANPASRGVFTEGTINTRRFIIRDPNSYIRFQYAILARWAFHEGFPDPPLEIPGAFPPQANATEAVAISVTNDTSDMWFEGSEAGGNFTAELSVVNWNAEPDGGVMSDYQVQIGSESWSDTVLLDMTVESSGDNYCNYIVDIPVAPTASGGITVWIEIRQADDTYTNPFGVTGGADGKLIAAYFTHTASVSNQNPSADFWEPPTGHDPRFLFIHHSCGSGFLNNGGMWAMLEAAGFEVHDRTYGDGWVGDNTDPNDWPVTFTDYYDDMINWELEPGEYYDIVAFKSCYPACQISSEAMLEDYYGYYAIVQSVTEVHPETLFVPWSPPPLNPTATNPDNAARARTFANWLTSPYDDGEFNMQSFDCFNVLAGTDPLSGDYNMLRYDYQNNTSDSHPNHEGNVAVAEAFTTWLTALVWD